MKNIIEKSYLLILILMLGICACKKNNFHGQNGQNGQNGHNCTLTVDGNGISSTKAVNLSNFTGIANYTSINIECKRGNTQEVVLFGDENIIPFVKLEVINGLLSFKLQDDICLNNFNLRAEVTVPTFDHLEIRGSGNFNTSTAFVTNQLLLDIQGSGNMDLFSTSTNDCTAIIAGSGNINITAQNTLNLTINGSGNVYYRGNPTITQAINGSGNLFNAN